eukprot:TRINITY_DN12205_c0_g1_i1.p1 TRINITY_DN12205_c0_g1~~TRINITY_DN12205_c0_g1_i1.p1  ORF type:complete len:252 (-),score=26.34 TRINITY_DN12205_c0_g1_i1:13-747(-)
MELPNNYYMISDPGRGPDVQNGTHLLPRSWDYNYRWKEDFSIQFRGKTIKIKQSDVGSRVGATVWDICIAMCKYFERSEYKADYFRTKRFIELGSGVGLLGIAIAAMGAHITLTDQARMIPILEKNVKDNIKVESYKVKVAELDWGDNVPAVNPPFDVIVGSDLTYEAEAIPPLIRVLRALSDLNTTIIYGHEERGMDCESIFYTLAHRYFDYEKIPANSLHENFADFKGWIVIMKKRELERES